MRAASAASAAALAMSGLLSACAVVPAEPGILALPGTGKSLEQFQGDDSECRRYAADRASAPAASTTYDAQRRYDFAYIQCMYSKGHKVPVSGAYAGPPGGNVPPPAPPVPPAAAPAPPAAMPAPAQQQP
jgi:hypothetical protein